jgi:hypothetical protein
MKSRKEANMPNHVPFDTLKFAKKLEERGVAVKQAEAHAEVLAEVLEASFMTKHDTHAGLDKLSQEMIALHHEMNTKFAESKTDIIKWVFGISFAQAALIISVLKFFH